MKQSLTAYIHSAFGTAVATGALAGAASGAIMTGTLQGTLKGALFGAISAGVAYGIGHGGGLFAKVRQYGGSLGKATLHGISRAAISKLQTGSGKGGFLSGFASSILGGVVNNIQTASTTLKVAAAAIAGGTASAIGGGKFANGAMSGAFIMLFNDLAHSYPSKLNKLSLSSWKYGTNGRYKTWLVNGQDTGMSQYAPFEYYNGKSPADRFFNGVGNFIARHPDEVGLALSVSAAATSGGASLLFGVSALALDTISGDWYGAGIGVFAMRLDSFVPIDIAYGACRANDTCSQFLDDNLP